MVKSVIVTNGGSGWREDSGLLTDKSALPVTQIRLGDLDDSHEEGYHTLGKLNVMDRHSELIMLQGLPVCRKEFGFEFVSVLWHKIHARYMRSF